jgi:hypothetical protein
MFKLPFHRKYNQKYNKNYNIVKPVLRGHLWDKEKWPSKTSDILQEVQFIRNFL